MKLGYFKLKRLLSTEREITDSLLDPLFKAVGKLETGVASYTNYPVPSSVSLFWVLSRTKTEGEYHQHRVVRFVVA